MTTSLKEARGELTTQNVGKNNFSTSKNVFKILLKNSLDSSEQSIVHHTLFIFLRDKVT